MYQVLNNSECVKRLSDGAIIPNNPDNSDFQAYQVWVDEGNEPEQEQTPIVDRNAALQAQIDAIERETMVPRVMREFLLTSAALEAQRQADALTKAGKPTTADQLLAKNIGYVKTKAINDQIAQLREQMQ